MEQRSSQTFRNENTTGIPYTYSGTSYTHQRQTRSNKSYLEYHEPFFMTPTWQNHFQMVFTGPAFSRLIENFMVFETSALVSVSAIQTMQVGNRKTLFLFVEQSRAVVLEALTKTRRCPREHLSKLQLPNFLKRVRLLVACEDILKRVKCTKDGEVIIELRKLTTGFYLMGRIYEMETLGQYTRQD